MKFAMSAAPLPQCYQNLKRTSSLAGNKNLVANKDFEALGSLVVALERIASVNLRQSASQAAEVDLSVLLDELKIVIAPSLRRKKLKRNGRSSPACRWCGPTAQALCRCFSIWSPTAPERSPKRVIALSLLRPEAKATRFAWRSWTMAAELPIPNISFAPFRPKRNQLASASTCRERSCALSAVNCATFHGRRRLFCSGTDAGQRIRLGIAMHEIRILMVDDHSLFRESLGRLLRD